MFKLSPNLQLVNFLSVPGLWFLLFAFHLQIWFLSLFFFFVIPSSFSVSCRWSGFQSLGHLASRICVLAPKYPRIIWVFQRLQLSLQDLLQVTQNFGLIQAGIAHFQVRYPGRSRQKTHSLQKMMRTLPLKMSEVEKNSRISF